MKTYGVPALLSLFVPGLGQLAKGDWGRAVLVWAYLALFGFVWFVAADTPENMPGKILVVLAGAIAVVATWLWQVVDAYRRPG